MGLFLLYITLLLLFGLVLYIVFFEYTELNTFIKKHLSRPFRIIIRVTFLLLWPLYLVGVVLWMLYQSFLWLMPTFFE